MTPEQIKEEIREFLALSEKATAGPWHVDYNCTNLIHSPAVEIAAVEDDSDSAFIARSRNISPIMAKALLEAIEKHEEVIACFNVAEFEGLQERLSEQQYETGNLRDLIERRIYHAKLASETAIKTICRTWEESK